MECYQRCMPKLWRSILLTIWNGLLTELIDKAVLSFYNRFRSCVGAASGHSEVRNTDVFLLNSEWAVGSWHSLLEHFNCWRKAMQSLICYSSIFNPQLHDHLKKWTLKFNSNNYSYNNNNQDDTYGAVIMAQSYRESSSGWFQIKSNQIYLVAQNNKTEKYIYKRLYR